MGLNEGRSAAGPSLVRRRAWGLVELLVVVGILAVLAALLFPAFARSKERAKLTSCGSRLRQFAVALNLYRADHDGLGFRWVYDADHPVAFHFPYNSFEPMKAYLGDGRVLWCPLPSRTSGGVEGAYLYRTWSTESTRAGSRQVRHRPFAPTPGSVLAFCSNHTQEDLANATAQRGSMPFVREDASLSVADAKAVRVMYYSARGWFDASAPGRTPIYRFPGEPWPPTPEE